jgi:hypothetical protein
VAHAVRQQGGPCSKAAKGGPCSKAARRPVQQGSKAARAAGQQGGPCSRAARRPVQQEAPYRRCTSAKHSQIVSFKADRSEWRRLIRKISLSRGVAPLLLPQSATSHARLPRPPPALLHLLHRVVALNLHHLAARGAQSSAPYMCIHSRRRAAQAMPQDPSPFNCRLKMPPSSRRRRIKCTTILGPPVLYLLPVVDDLAIIWSSGGVFDQ